MSKERNVFRSEEKDKYEMVLPLPLFPSLPEGAIDSGWQR